MQTVVVSSPVCTTLAMTRSGSSVGASGAAVHGASSSLALSAASWSLGGALSHARLLGVALVLSGDFGTRTAFRYPVPTTGANKKHAPKQSHASMRASPSGAHLVSDDGSADSPLVGAANSAKSEPSDDENESKHAQSGATGTSLVDDIYGMSPDEFARLFCPKLSLCARVLDVSVDGLRFVSFPVRLRYQEGRAFQARARRRRARERVSARQRVNLRTGGGGTADQLAARSDERTGEKPNVAPHGSNTDSESDDAVLDDDDADGSGDDDVVDGEHELTFFNVVFVLSGGVSPELAAMYGHVAAQLARALLHEQTRAHFVSQQAQLLVSIREKYLNTVARASAAASGPGGPRGAAPPKPVQPDFHALAHLLLSHSLLANHLHHLYYGLLQQEFERFGGGPGLGLGGPLASLGVENNHGLAAHSGRAGATASTADGIATVSAAFAKLGAQLAQSHNTPSTTAATAARNAATKLLQVDHSHTTLLINNWFPLNLALSALPLPVDVAPASSMRLRPYQTLLLTVPASELLQSLPGDCSPLLRRLISQTDPRMNFTALAATLRLPLTQLYRLVTHLFYWNKCILIDAVSGDNVYAINERACQSAMGHSSGRARQQAVSFHHSARRSLSARAGSSSGSGRSRRRSSSVDSMPSPVATTFIPAAMLYEWTQQFAGGALSLLAVLTRLSAPALPPPGSPPGPAPRTLSQHMHRIAASAAAVQSAHGGSSTSTSTASSVPPAVSSSKLRAQVQSEFLAQLLFLIKKQWVVQVQRWFIRIDDDDEDDDDDDEDDDEDAADYSVDGSRGGLSASHSARSLRSLDDSRATTATVDSSTDDPWRALLDRLTPLYFDGRHSLVEILWSERETGLTYAHLQHLITLFPKQLVTVMHP